MAKKLKLNVKYVPEFEVLGLFSSLSEHRLCWFVNSLLNIKLYREKDVLLYPYRAESPVLFPFYIYKDKTLMINYYIIKNRAEDHVLLPEPKNLDYLMLLRAKDIRIDLDDMVNRLRKIPQISMAVWFKEPGKVKNLDSLLYDFEHALIEKSQ